MMRSRSDEIRATKEYWLAWINYADNAEMLTKTVLGFGEDLRELTPQDLKTVCYALLCPRFHRSGLRFIQQTLLQDCDDQKLCYAMELAEHGDKVALAALLAPILPKGVLHPAELKLAEQAMPKHRITQVELSKQRVSDELCTALKPSDVDIKPRDYCR